MKSVSSHARRIVSLLGICLILLAGAVTCAKEPSAVPELSPHEHRPGSLFLPAKGCVPDETTAVQIAEAIWLPLYGKSICKKKPFRAELLGDSLWVVAGSLSPNTLGGVPYIEIQKRDGKVLGIGHAK